MTQNFKEQLFLSVVSAFIQITPNVNELKAPQRDSLASQSIKLTESLFIKYQQHEQKLFTENYKED